MEHDLERFCCDHPAQATWRESAAVGWERESEPSRHRVMHLHGTRSGNHFLRDIFDELPPCLGAKFVNSTRLGQRDTEIGGTAAGGGLWKNSCSSTVR